MNTRGECLERVNRSRPMRGRWRRRRGAVFMGVCAGIADFLNIDRNVVRLGALIMLWLFTLPTLLLYAFFAWLGDSR